MTTPASPITWDQVTALVPSLCSATIPTQTMILSIVASQLDPCVWGDQLTQGAIYLAAHIATLSMMAGAGGIVSQESVGQISTSYAINPLQLKNDLGLTAWGAMFERLTWGLPTALGLVP